MLRIWLILILLGPFVLSGTVRAEGDGQGGAQGAVQNTPQDEDETDAEVADDLVKDVAAAVNANPALRNVFFENRQMPVGNPAADPNAPIQMSDIPQHVRTYLSNPIFFTVGKRGHQTTYRVEGIKDQNLLNAVTSLPPESQLKFLIDRQMILGNLAHKLHSQKKALGAIGKGEILLRNRYSAAVRAVRERLPGRTESGLTGPVVPYPKSSVPNLNDASNQLVNAALSGFNTLLAQRARVIADHNEAGVLGLAGLALNFKLGKLSFYKSVKVGVKGGTFKSTQADSDAGKNIKGRSFEIYMTHGDERDTLPPLIARASGSVYAAVYFRHREGDLISNGATPGITSNLPIPGFPGVKIYCTDSRSATSMGIVVGIPGSDMISAAAGLAGGLMAGPHVGVGTFGAMKGTIKLAGKLAMKVGGKVRTVVNATSAPFPSQVERVHDPLLLVTWLPGKKLPVVQVGKIILDLPKSVASAAKKIMDCPSALALTGRRVTPPQEEEL